MGIREFQLSIDGTTCSGRLAQPEGAGRRRPPIVVAIHGGTYYSRYFDVPNYSLLEAAMEADLATIAIDRPGYGQSSSLPDAPDLLHHNALYLNGVIPQIVGELMPGEAMNVILSRPCRASVPRTMPRVTPGLSSGGTQDAQAWTMISVLSRKRCKSSASSCAVE